VAADSFYAPQSDSPFELWVEPTMFAFTSLAKAERIYFQAKRAFLGKVF
jgi:hypothetical protein